MKTYKSESNIKPLEWQIEKTFVYHNFNVVEVEKEQMEEKEIAYVYDVEEYTKDEYMLLKNQQNSDAIDDILVMLLEN